MIIFYLLLIAFSNSEGFPSEPEGSGYQDVSECIDYENVDKIQRELKEQRTVVKKMMSNIQSEMTKMKECLVRSEENMIADYEGNIAITDAESISACTAALEESIQEAVDWASPQKEDHVGISDPGESQDFI